MEGGRKGGREGGREGGSQVSAVSASVSYYLHVPSTFTPIGNRAFIFILPCSPRLSLILLLN